MGLDMHAHSEPIRLDWGWPSLSLNPIEAFQSSSIGFFSDPERIKTALHYGTFVGADDVRETYAHFLNRHRSMPITPEHLFITSGAGTAIDMLCTLHADTGQTVLTQNATYQNALKIFANHGLKAQPIPEEANGQLNLELLDTLLSEQRDTVALMYLIPTFANPTGRTLDETTRIGLGELAQRHKILIIADEVYHPLSFSDASEPPPVLSHYDSSGRYIISLGSFTKIAAPGLRLGWAEVGAPPSARTDKDNLIVQLSRHGVVQNGGCLNQISSMLVAELIRTGGLSQHLATLRNTYRARAEVLYHALSKRLSPELVSISEAGGGYYLWLEPTEALSAVMAQIGAAAEKHGVRFRMGSQFTPPASDGLERVRRGFRLCFAYYDRAELELGAQRLSRAIIETVSETRP